MGATPRKWIGTQIHSNSSHRYDSLLSRLMRVVRTHDLPLSVFMRNVWRAARVTRKAGSDSLSRQRNSGAFRSTPVPMPPLHPASLRVGIHSHRPYRVEMSI